MFTVFLKLANVFRILESGILLGVPGQSEQRRFTLVRKAKVFWWPRVTIERPPKSESKEPVVAVAAPNEQIAVQVQPPADSHPMPTLPEKVELVYKVEGKLNRRSKMKSRTATLTSLNLARVCLEIWNFVYKDLLERAKTAGMQWQKNPPDNSGEQARGVMQETVDAALLQFRTRVSGGINQAVDGTLNALINTLLTSGSLAIKNLKQLQVDTRSINRHEVLPDHTKLFFAAGEIEVIVLEVPPQRRTLVFANNLAGARPAGIPSKSDNTKFHLALPYMVFAIKFTQGYPAMQVFYRNQPLASMNDILYTCNLPNVSSSGSVCLGTYKGSRKGSLAERVEEVMDFYWKSQFTYFQFDGDGDYKTHPDKRINNLWAWEQESLKDPAFVLQVEWKPLDMKVSDQWSKLCADALTGKQQTAFKAEVNVAIAPGKKQLKEAIEQYCQNVKTNGQFSKESSNRLAGHLNVLVAQALDSVTRNLNNGEYRAGLWNEFMSLLNRHGNVPSPSRGTTKQLKKQRQMQRKNER